MAKLHAEGIPKHIDLRLFFTETGELLEIMIIKEKFPKKEHVYPNTDVPFEEYIGVDHIVYAGQIDINGGKFDGGQKIVIMQDSKDEDDMSDVTEFPYHGAGDR